MTTDTRALRYLGGQLACGEAKCIETGDEYLIRTMGGASHVVPIALRPSWVRYAHRGRPAGRKRASEPSIQMGLTLRTSTYKRIPTPRPAWVRRVIEDRLMCDDATEYLTGGAA